MKHYFQPDLYKIHPYIPGEQPAADKKIIKLNTNENPYPPSPKIKPAINKILKKGLLRKYPNPISKDLVKEISDLHNVSSDMILVTNGSDEALSLLFRAVLGNKGRLVIPYPTYSLYPILADLQMNSVTVEKIPLLGNLHFDFPKLKKTKANLLAFANPNAPTGIRENKRELLDLISHFSGVVLCDEAYIDFATKGTSLIGHVKDHENLFVSRTFSKSYSLAGLRVGYIISQTRNIELLFKLKDSYNLGMLEQEIATIALKDQKYFEQVIKKIIKSREKLATELMSLSFTVVPSETNFLFVRPPFHVVPEELFNYLKSKGIYIRYFKDDISKNYLRITVGNERENRALIQEIKKFL